MDRVVARIIELLTANVKTIRHIKQIYDGDVWAIPKASMPCIIVNANRTVVETITNTQDNDIYTVDITVVLDARDYFNSSANKKSGIAILKEIMEEREDDTTNEVKSDTILKTIRSGFDSDSDYSLRAKCELNYGFNDQREFPTVEANMQVQILSKIYTR